MLSTAAHPPRLQSLVLSLRPAQWTKNLIVFAALLFGGFELRARGTSFLDAAALAAAAFLIFCALSGVVYLINDVQDRHADARHPVKARRPIASGAVPVRDALVFAAALGAAALAGAFALGTAFGVISLAYVSLLGFYSLSLKHIVIVDVMTIAMGFVLRAFAGAVAIGVPLSQWALIVTILLALFLALSKRRHELVSLAGEAAGHRPSLREYSPYLLDQMISVVTAATVVAYASYTISADTVAKFGTDQLALTLPFPLYGIFRYLYLVHQRDGGGSPSEMLLTDGPLLACVALWVAAVGLILYGPW